MIGKTLAHYEILDKLGEGAMGEVYLARDRKLGRKVALKMLPMPMSDHPDHLARFGQEAKAIAALNHPNIVTIYSVEEDDDLRFFTMELIEGKTLKECLPENGLPLPEFVDIAMRITDALEAARQRGVIHRDLKPSNIMVTAEGRIKILDFGLAKLRGKKDVPKIVEETLTQAGSMLGTVPYMSPEQVEGRTLDHRSDLFSLGIVLYELVTGRRPFQAESWARLISSILRDEPKPVTDLRPSLPQHLSQILSKCLEKNKSRRYQTARELWQDLEQLKMGSTSVEISIRPSVAAVAPRSIAVLPFVNLSADPEQEYFADGLAEELINALARLSELRVAARTSSFFFKGKDVSIRDVGDELNVASVLEGSVRKAGNRLRINAQLIEAASGYHLWSERFDRQLDDVFAIQDEIAKTIAETLKLKLVDEASQLVRRYTHDMDAYNAYLRGRFYWSKRERDAMQKGLRSFEEAIERDPSFALAYTGLADAYNTLAFYEFLAPKVGFTKGRELAEKALELDDSLAEAHTSLALTKALFEWDWQEGEREFQRALELNPSYGTAHLWYSLFLTAMERADDSLKHITLAQQAEPLSMIINGISSFLMYHARRFDRGLEEAEKALDLDPTFGPGHSFLGWNYDQLGRHDEAVDAWRKAVRYLPGCLTESMLGYALARAGQTDEARQILGELVGDDSDRYISPYYVAALCVGLEETDMAFDWLRRGCSERDSFLIFLGVDPVFDPLRDDERFAEILTTVGLRSP